MVSRHTFHTPSFGDEEFEFPQMQHGLLGGSSHTYDMAGVSASENYSQWSMSNQSDHMKADSGMSLVGNEFVVLRSPQEAAENANASSADQPLSTDESDDAMKPDAKHGAGDIRRKQKHDPNAPQKPVSAYALFFRDTQAAIKGQNPSASFTEVSKIVASMWDVLDPEHKDVYKKKAEDAKKEYRKSLSAYRSSVLAKSDDLTVRAEKPQVVDTTTPVPQQQVQLVESTPVVNAISTASSLSLNQTQQQIAAIPAVATNQATQNVGMSAAEHPVAAAIVPGQTCVRSGCPNPAVVSIDWEDEYCSNECVITHCRDIFSRWVQDISAAPESYATT